MMLRPRHALGLALVLVIGCSRGIEIADDGEGGAGGTSVNVGPGSTGSGPGSTGSGPGSSSSGTMVCAAGDACTQCIASSCSDVWCSCVNNPECFALYSCVGDCGGDQGCATDCYTAHSAGLSDAALVADCAATACDGSCNWGGEPLDPCQKCLYTDCADEMNACIGNTECVAVWQCLQGCGPTQLSCHQACYDAHPSGVMPLEDLFSCSTNSCPDTCN
ncbi:MAG TPA: hypothetical protein VL400_14490 [Polyangiaceae bacterium]|jgi:hypothetical protein|nr:hypothetical protein [Polyangiaceae bacterium]